MTRILPPLLLTALLLAAWEIACRALEVPAYFLPPPSAVAIALVDRAPILAASAAATFWMALQALILAGLLGGGLALAVSLSRPAEQAVRPLAVALQVTPVVAIAPLVLIWTGLDHADRAVVAPGRGGRLLSAVFWRPDRTEIGRPRSGAAVRPVRRHPGAAPAPPAPARRPALRA
jgi:ABC-type nitrate/sulfonate/bicarbonate transport system permease component